MKNEFNEVTARIHRFIRDKSGDFDELTHQLATLQRKHVEPYRRYCEQRRASSSEIIALPTSAFREFDITGLPDDDRSVVFYSSSTTDTQPSRHFHNVDSLCTYELSLRKGFQQNAPRTPQTLSLTPAPIDAPHSSLAYMLQCVQENPIFTGITTENGWQVDINETQKRLHAATEPITIMGTAFSFIHLCDAMENIMLPDGSYVMETGGYKGQSRELPKTELHALIAEKLGISSGNILCEYGMCELSSQAYATSTSLFHFPHWARTRIVSPENGREVSIGETGLIEIVDLANIRSVLAIRTSDLAVRHADGFKLLGRLQNAEPRGCSLTAAE